MPSRSTERILALSALALISTSAVHARELRVCADPNNLPFSNQKMEGFENKIAAVVANELGARLEYVWAPLWRGFVRKTLNAGICDVLPGVPEQMERLTTTRPYYSASYVFLQPAENEAVTSLDDPRLATLKIGVQLVGDDGANTPPMDALERRHTTSNVRGFMVIGDWGKPHPLRPIVDAVSSGEIDLALVWGPIAGYYALTVSRPLRITPIPPEPDVHLLFSIAMGVRKDDNALAADLNSAIERRRNEIDAILDTYSVPRTTLPSAKHDEEVSP